MKTIAEQIKFNRQCRHLTQTKLAKLLGMPQSEISELEKGKHSPTVVTLQRIATVLQCVFQIGFKEK